MLIKPLIARRPRVEMIPLIDMFFLLLVFFIFSVFSMTMQQGIAVELPSAVSASDLRDEEVVTISMTPDGGLLVNRQPVTMDTLPQALRQASAGRPDPLVVLQADRQVPHGAVVAVLDAVRQAGLRNVSFQTEPAEDATP